MLPNIAIFNREISYYAVMAMIGILACCIYASKVSKKHNLNKDDQLLVMLLWSGLGLFLGGHILYGITNIEKIKILVTHFDKIKSFKHFIDCFVEIFGGQVFYGGLIGCLLTAYIYASKHKIDKEKLFDLLIPMVPLFHIFGRLGCFLSGCCFGIESKIGFVYHHSLVEVANGVRRFPVQLVEAGYNVILFIILFILSKKGKLKGRLVYLYFIMYPIGRFILEFFRGDDYRGFLFGLSTSQIIGIILLIFGTVMMVKKTKEVENNKKTKKKLKKS